METEYFGGENREQSGKGRLYRTGTASRPSIFFKRQGVSVFFLRVLKTRGQKTKAIGNKIMRRVFAGGIFSSFVTWHPGWGGGAPGRPNLYILGALSRLWPGTPGKEPPRLKGPVAPEVFDQAARSGKARGWMERCRDFGEPSGAARSSCCFFKEWGQEINLIYQDGMITWLTY